MKPSDYWNEVLKRDPRLSETCVPSRFQRRGQDADTAFDHNTRPLIRTVGQEQARLPEASPQIHLSSRENEVHSDRCQRYTVWIDGVGAWQLLIGRNFLVGAPTLESDEADISLLANISRRHATIQKIQEDWFIQAHQSTVVSGRSVGDRAVLRTGDEIQLGERVRLGFRIPSVLSSSAVVDFESHHRPSQSVNGIILMTDSCLLGPRQDYHVCCHDWPDLMILFVQDGQLRCRSRMPFRVDGEPARDIVTVTDGATVSGDEFRFRIEKMKTGR
ncbi:MAG: FHA domain-containing protein [Planctomycetaceae bacterium]|nr:FHA domain-containing protein [Planctomycetaceae bacterium]